MQSITSLVTLYFKVIWGCWGSSVHNCVTWYEFLIMGFSLYFKMCLSDGKMLGLLLGYSFIFRGLMGFAVVLTYAVKCSLFSFFQLHNLWNCCLCWLKADSLITLVVLINKDLCYVSLFLSWALSDPTHSNHVWMKICTFHIKQIYGLLVILTLLVFQFFCGKTNNEVQD